MTQYWPFSVLRRYGGLRQRLIVSLDMTSRREALSLVDRLGRSVGMFKVGRALFMGGGPDFVREMRRRGAEIFLDLKFQDTSAEKLTRAAIEATRLGVKMFDVRLSGGDEAMRQMRKELARVCHREGLRRPRVIAVAILAGVDRERPQRPGDQAADQVLQLTRRAAEASLDGVFTSPPEVQRVRSLCGRRFIIVTSGIRLGDGIDHDAQTIRAGDAVRAGADYLMVGGRVWKAAEPARTVSEITARMERRLVSEERSPAEIITSRGRG